MINLKALKPAKRYAEALFEGSGGAHEKISDDIKQFLSALEIEDLKNFLFHPVISKDDKKELIKSVFSGFEQNTLNFLSILIDENRLDCLNEIYGFFKEKIDNKNNITRAEITLAIDPNPALKDFIQKRIENKFKASVELTFAKNEEILGGMLIKTGDTVIDLSLKNKIENFMKV